MYIESRLVLDILLTNTALILAGKEVICKDSLLYLRLRTLPETEFSENSLKQDSNLSFSSVRKNLQRRVSFRETRLFYFGLQICDLRFVLIFSN